MPSLEPTSHTPRDQAEPPTHVGAQTIGHRRGKTTARQDENNPPIDSDLWHLGEPVEDAHEQTHLIQMVQVEYDDTESDSDAETEYLTVNTNSKPGAGPAPKILLKIEGMDTLALLDTGARANLMHYDLFLYLQGQSQHRLPVRPSKGIKLVTANNSRMTPRGEALLTVQVKNVTFQMTFLLASDLSCPLLIGDESLGQGRLRSVIDLAERTVTFKRYGITIPLVERPSVHQQHIMIVTTPQIGHTLEPHSVTRVPLSLDTSTTTNKLPSDDQPQTHDHEGMLIGYDHPKEDGPHPWQIMGGLSEVSNGKIEAFIANVTDERVTLRPSSLMLTTWPADTKAHFRFDKLQSVANDISAAPREETLVHTLSVADAQGEDHTEAITSKPEMAMDLDHTGLAASGLLQQCAVNQQLNNKQRSELAALLERHAEAFREGHVWKCNTDVEHEINTGSSKPIRQTFYRVTPEKQKIIDEEVQKLLDAGIIEPASGPWSSPVVLVKKPGGKWRLCVDFRRLNAVTQKSIFPLPPIKDILAMLGGSQWYSSLDIAQGFHRIPIKQEDRQKTAFIVPGHCGGALYQYVMLPFGLANAPAAFQRMMAEILGGCPFATTYVDDILVFSTSWEAHLSHVEAVLNRIKQAGLVCKPEKCQLACTEIDYLGHRVSVEGICPLARNVEAIKAFSTPRTRRAVQSFAGMANYYRDHIANFSTIMAPITSLCKKNLVGSIVDNWGAEQEKAFNLVKHALTTDCMLYYPDWSKGFTLRTDASNIGIGAILLQEGRPICYLSRKLNDAERNYKVWEQEMLAIIWSITKLRPYLAGRRFLVQTDHRNMCYLLNVKADSGRLARWAMLLADYDITVEHKPGKDMQDPDALSRQPVDLSESPRPSNRIIPNAGEEEAALDEVAADAPTNGAGSITFTTQDGAEPYTLHVATTSRFGEAHTYSEIVEAQRACEECQKIMQDLANKDDRQGGGESPAEPDKEGESTARFAVIGGTLMRVAQTPMGVCTAIYLPEPLRATALWNCHNSGLAGHAGYRRSLHRLREQYYWPNMRGDLGKHIRSCVPCQRAKAKKPTMQGLTQPTNTYVRCWDSISIDLLGPFVSSLRRQNKWCLTVIDSYSNYATLIPLPDKMATTIAEALFERIILVHGTPKRILSDREAVFRTADVTRALTSIFHIKQVFTSSYHPNTNGSCERLHRFINACIKCMCQEITRSGAAWDSHLEVIQFVYNTAPIDYAQGFTPHYLLYGRQPTMPEACLTDGTEAIRQDLPEHVASLQQRLAWAAQRLTTLRAEMKSKNKEYRDLRRRDFELDIGDWVLIQKEHVTKGLTKTQYQYTEPRRVVQKFSPVLYGLSLEDGTPVDGRFNVARLVKCHRDGTPETGLAAHPSRRGSAPRPRYVIEDCAGTGQLSHAFQQKGFKVIAVNDVDEIARDVCQTRLGDDVLISHDVQECAFTELSRVKKRRTRLLLGGYPCQSFSTANPDRLGAEDIRAGLACSSMHRILDDPDYNVHEQGNLTFIIAENVTNKETESNEIVAAEEATAKARGYTRSSFEIRSWDYGEPQHRIRTISWTEPEELTIALGPPEAPPGTSSSATPRQEVLLSDLLVEPQDRAEDLWITSEDATFEPTPHTLIVEDGPLRVGFIHTSRGTTYPVWSTKGLAWTVRATGLWPKGSGGGVYWDERVRRPFMLSAKECWKVQGLPDDLYEYVTQALTQKGHETADIDRELRKLAGNAVSTGVARALAKYAEQRMDKYDALKLASRLGSRATQMAPASGTEESGKTHTSTHTSAEPPCAEGEASGPDQGEPSRSGSTEAEPQSDSEPEDPNEEIGKFIVAQYDSARTTGGQKENWRVGRIIEALPHSGHPNEPAVRVHFYESYKKPKDLSKREYKPSWIDPEDGLEVYTHKPPPNPIQMVEDVQFDNRITGTFIMAKNGRLPRHIIEELKPAIVHVNACQLYGHSSGSINPDKAVEIRQLLDDVTNLLDQLRPFPTQLRRNYAKVAVEGFILGLSRTYDFATQHLQEATANSQHPELHLKLRQAMALQDPEFTFTSIQVNHSTIAVHAHRDAYNIGPSYALAVGNFTGGEFLVAGHKVDINHKFWKFDGNQLHKPLPHYGERYSLIFFTPVPRIIDVGTKRGAEGLQGTLASHRE